MLGLLLVLIATLATAFWGLFAWQNLNLIFGWEMLPQFLPAEQAFLGISVISPVLVIWFFVAWRWARKKARRLEMTLQMQGQRMTLQDEEAHFQQSGGAGYAPLASPLAAEDGFQDTPVQAAPLVQQAEELPTETQEVQEAQLSGAEPESERFAAQGRIAPSVGLPLPLESDPEPVEDGAYDDTGDGEHAATVEGGAPPSVFGSGLKLEDLIREKEDQDRREANKWEIDPEHPFSDSVPQGEGGAAPAKVSLADVMAEEAQAVTPVNSVVAPAALQQTQPQQLVPSQQPVPPQQPVPLQQAARAPQEPNQTQQHQQPQKTPKQVPQPVQQPEQVQSPPEPIQPQQPPETQSKAVQLDQIFQAAPLQPEALVVGNGTASAHVPPRAIDSNLIKPQALSSDRMDLMEKRVRGELNSIAMDLASVISAPERYDQAFQLYNGGGQDAFFQLVAEDLVLGQGPQMSQQLRLLGGEAMLKSYVEKYQHLLTTSQLSDDSGQSTQRLSRSGLGVVCRALMESQSQGAD